MSSSGKKKIVTKSKQHWYWQAQIHVFWCWDETTSAADPLIKTQKSSAELSNFDLISLQDTPTIVAWLQNEIDVTIRNYFGNVDMKPLAGKWKYRLIENLAVYVKNH